MQRVRPANVCTRCERKRCPIFVHWLWIRCMWPCTMRRRRQHTKRRGLLHLRRGLAKFNNHADGQGGDWGAFFTGHAEVRFTSHETTLRRQISDGRMTKGIAQRLLNSMETISTWGRRADFIEFLAAFSAVYRSEVTNKTEDGKRLVDLLHHATDGDQVEWLVNNLRLRSLFSKGDDAPSWNNQQ